MIIEIKVSELQQRTINSLIDENQRFIVVHDNDDDNSLEEEHTKDVTDKVALLREQFLRDSNKLS